MRRTGLAGSGPMKPKVLIVDGHSMIFRQPELADMHARNATAARGHLVKMLRDLQDGSDWTVAVVFDGRGTKPSNESEPDGIRIFYSKSGQTADSIIERLAAKYTATCEVTVATDDRMERVTAEAFGSLSISSLQLFDEIERARRGVADEIRRIGRKPR